jgi:tRNA pseudouridine38-40 synthase
MPRYRIIIEYDGTPFVGWQAQAEGEAVQTTLERAINGFSGETVRVRGAGRTDAGVHALGQVGHFDLSREFDPWKVREAINHLVRPWPVAVRECALAAPDFDARFSATRRAYLYRILTRRAPPALDRNRVWWVPYALDAAAMARAAQALVGRHDFTTFRAAQCQAPSPVKTLDCLDVEAAGEEIRVVAEARSFLHHQVRSIVGTLKLVGRGQWSEAQVAEALAARDRSACGPVAPPQGLYLTAVRYNDEAITPPSPEIPGG